MQVEEAEELDLKLCQSLIDFLKRGRFEVGALESHKLSNTIKWVNALAISIAQSYEREKVKAKQKASKPGMKIKSIQNPTT